MPNPFPGVDPYIEAAGLWPGFHNLLVGDCSRLLNRQLKPRGYGAFVKERLEVVDLPDGDEDRRPDLAVTRGPDANAAAPSVDMGEIAVMDVEPVTLTLPAYEVLTVAYVELWYLPDPQLVTSIEMLSPSNKGSSRGGYVAKRRAVLATAVNLVEVDLLLAGRRSEVVGDVPPGDFQVLVSRGDRRPGCEVYAWSVRRALPHRLAIPLRPGDQDATLDLSAAYAMTFEDGPYEIASLYARPVPDALSVPDQAWVADRVAAIKRK